MRTARLTTLLGSAVALALLVPALPAVADGPATSYAYLAVSRSGAAVYVNGLIKQASPSGVIRSPKRTVIVQRQLSGSWQNVIARVTGGDGYFSVGYLSPPSYDYRLVVLASDSATGATSATATSPVLGAVMPAGRTIYVSRTSSSRITTPSGEFTLQVDSKSVSLDETENYPDGYGYGAVTWWQFDGSSTNLSNDESRLSMQTDGNLVLYTSTGQVVWASHTSGTGSSNALYVQNNGNLVIYNPSGRVVWQSGTGRNLLTPGTILRPGQQYVSRYRQQYILATRFVMQTNGDLALYYGSTMTWHTKTHVAGSRAYFLSNGNLAIFGPNNEVLWQSGTSGIDGVLSVDSCGQASIGFKTPGPLWYMPAGGSPYCG